MVWLHAALSIRHFGQSASGASESSVAPHFGQVREGEVFMVVWYWPIGFCPFLKQRWPKPYRLEETFFHRRDTIPPNPANKGILSPREDLRQILKCLLDLLFLRHRLGDFIGEALPKPVAVVIQIRSANGGYLFF